MFFTGVALWLAGGLKQSSVAATWIGLGLNGLFVSGIFIPMIPELMGTTEAFIDEKKKEQTQVEPHLGTVDNETEEQTESNLADKSAALHNIFFALGSTAGPPLGGGLYDAIGWQKTCLVMSIFSLVISIFYGSFMLLISSCNNKSTSKGKF